MPAPNSTPAGDPAGLVGTGRRTVLKGLASGAAGIAAFPLLAACSSSSKSNSSTTTSAERQRLRPASPPPAPPVGRLDDVRFQRLGPFPKRPTPR